MARAKDENKGPAPSLDANEFAGKTFAPLTSRTGSQE